MQADSSALIWGLSWRRQQPPENELMALLSEPNTDASMCHKTLNVLIGHLPILPVLFISFSWESAYASLSVCASVWPSLFLPFSPSLHSAAYLDFKLTPIQEKGYTATPQNSRRTWYRTPHRFENSVFGQVPWLKWLGVCLWRPSLFHVL